jgi:hypothetical protein
MAATRFVEMPAEWGGKVPTQVFINEAKRILREASDAKVPLKILGGLAIKIHSLNEEEFAARLGRSAEPGQEYSDIDFATYYKSRAGVRKVMESLGYSKRPSTMSTSASQRQIYFHPKGWFYVDVFLGQVEGREPYDKLPRSAGNRPDIDTSQRPFAGETSDHLIQSKRSARHFTPPKGAYAS